MRIIFTGGGTGGHLYPSIAIAQEIARRRPETEMQFIIGTREIERKIIEGAGYAFDTIPVKGYPRKISLEIASFIWNLELSVMKSFKILYKFKPSAIMATGGYVSAPPVLAGWFMKIPVFLLEQNSYPGIAAKKLAPFADTVFLGFRDAERYFVKRVRTEVTGNPVRKDVTDSITPNAAESFGLDPALKTVLVIGGSQGARAINDAFAEIVKTLADSGLQVIWQTGSSEYDMRKVHGEQAPKKIKVLAYIDNIGAAYAAADVVVSRAGAMAVAEIAVCSVPAVFIPLAAAAENHQKYNAASLVNSGAAEMITEKELTPEKLYGEITEILNSPEKTEDMKSRLSEFGNTDAAGAIARTLIERYGN